PLPPPNRGARDAEGRSRFDPPDLTQASEGGMRATRDLARARILEREGQDVLPPRPRGDRAGARRLEVAPLDFRRRPGGAKGDFGGGEARLPGLPNFDQPRLAGEAHQPPAIAGTMLIWSSLLSSVPSPFKKRTSSSPT